MSRYKIVPTDVSFKLSYRFGFDRLKYIVGRVACKTASDALFFWNLRLITRGRR